MNTRRSSAAQCRLHRRGARHRIDERARRSSTTRSSTPARRDPAAVGVRRRRRSTTAAAAASAASVGVPPRPGMPHERHLAASADHAKSASRDVEVDTIADRLLCGREDADEAVIVAVGHERERACRPATRPAIRSRRARRTPAPPVSIRRSARSRSACRCTNATRSPAGAIAGSSPSPSSFGAAPPAVATDHTCMRRLHGTARRIGLQVAVGRPVRAVIAAAHVDDRLAVGRERQARQFLPFVAGIRRDPARLKVRSVGGVNVSTASLVERPRDRGALRRRNQVVGERIVEDSFERERHRRRWRLRANRRGHHDETEQRHPQVLHGRIIIIALAGVPPHRHSLCGPVAAQEPGVHGRGGRVARDRHRLQHRPVRHRRCRAVQAAAGCGTGAPGRHLHQRLERKN